MEKALLKKKEGNGGWILFNTFLIFFTIAAILIVFENHYEKTHGYKQINLVFRV